MYKNPPFILSCVFALGVCYSPWLIAPSIAFLAIFCYMHIFQESKKDLEALKKLEDRLSHVEKCLAFGAKR